MAEAAQKLMTIEEFFAWEETQEERHELVDGVPVLRGEWIRYGDQWTMMSGASQRHDQIVVNLITALRTKLRGRTCRAFSPDMSVRTSSRRVRRPDSGVDCGPRRDRSTEASEPKVVIEVLSPSTRDFDMFAKLDEYRSVDAIDHVLLIDPNDPEAQLWSRGPDGWSEMTMRGLDATAELSAVGLSLPLAEVYEDVAFPARPEDAPAVSG
ncbi:Uma2 family endonuclease [Chelatococcus sambhunathii]|uniref:Uma2 family endonuclease n=1 Tax=Chelatococcus sambhunathii TaxID=363953 RepID=A0ABU1DI70_9HYPH|nr:Uma2 family endonuclease [Chelatococcus sambhunathii]MDR4307829.1 Uma2 family endonuclease [Chelatococcus sambhunathii]